MARISAKKSVISAAEQSRYQEISAAVAAKKAGNAVDAQAAVLRIQAALSKAHADTEANWGVETDAINEKDADFVGIVLGGYNSGVAMSGSELDVNTSDVYVEEPRIVAGDDEEADEEERSIWGDGDANPEGAEE
ncbi:unnamed protein product [Polarella glacialis]|uniref:Uncharacterized protein n=1 Tax=Polarella glacialis TaxID=89957 RepID=A0A813IZU0_POLGL|nr:unnamed protein product [Polarella glacialis]